MQCITYNDGYKYQLKADYTVAIDIKPACQIDTDFIKLDIAENLTLARGYAWDGPSGPTIDTLNFMRGSLIHDALYQLMRDSALDHNIHREAADRILQKICKEDGMWSLRAWWVYQGVRLFAAPAANPADKHPPINAPHGCTA